MTATAANVIDLDVARKNKERMGFLLAARARVRQARDMAISLPKKAWNWVVEKFHLRSVADFTRDILSMLKAKALTVSRFLGNGGLIGAGLLTVSTTPGRKVLSTVIGKPLAFIGGLIAKTWHGTVNLLVDKGGRPGAWVGSRMDDLECFLFGCKKDEYGLVGKVAGFLGKYALPHLAHDSILMSVAQFAGAALLAVPIAPYMGFTAVGMAAVAGVAALGAIAYTPVENIVGKVKDTVAARKVKKNASETVESVEALAAELVKNEKKQPATKAQHGPAARTAQPAGKRRR